MNDKNLSGRAASRFSGKLKIGVLCSFTVLAAPAANTCGAAPPEPWCAVQKDVLPTCAGCHGATPVAQATVKLTNYADTQAIVPANSIFYAGAVVWKAMQEKTLGTPKGSPMPLGTTLTDQQKADLQAWFDAGAPQNVNPCPP